MELTGYSFLIVSVVITPYLARAQLDISAFVDIVQKGGAGGAAIMAVMWWLERKERIRLQRVLEGYLLPMAQTTQRVMRSMHKVITGDDDDGA